MAGPKGAFALGQFACVRIEEAPPAIATGGRPYERVWLAGRGGAPDVLMPRTDRGAGVTLGRDLATFLRLPIEEASVPY